MSKMTNSTATRQSGFSLIELMITVAIIGILAMVALPSYNEYIQRSKIIDGTTKLGDFRAQMEKWFLDNRTYLNTAGTACGVADPVPSGSDVFQVTCPPGSATATTYILQADGLASKGMGSFVYRVNQLGAKSSSGPGGYFTAGNCWAIRKDGTCG
jgi:type IV pilus assembly protein PilE